MRMAFVGASSYFEHEAHERRDLASQAPSTIG